ncbi:MAG: RIP metalloprotease RseP [Gammaproteobacteria bacterium]|nr:RIP metalloprotease RseP [Gammaproteobacteria bacterium]
MLNLLYTIVMFIIAISILVAVHEFGHFWVAKRLGVKVLRYSIGIGKPLWIKRLGADQTEYTLSALPLGGYVKMLDEREGEVAEAELPRAFNRQTIWKRVAIVSAGPVFNFLFAIVAYWALYVIGVSGVKPFVGEVLAHSVAANAGMQSGEQIIAVNNTATPSWEEVLMQLWPVLVDKGNLVIKTQNSTLQEKTYVLDYSNLNLERGLKDPIKILGILPFPKKLLAPVIGKVTPGMAAAQAGLLAGDKILKLDDTEITDWNDIAPYIQKHCVGPIKFSIERNGQRQTITVKSTIITEQGIAVARVGIQPQPPPQESLPTAQPVVYSLSPWHSLLRAIGTTSDMSLMTVKLLGKIFTLEFSFRNIGGVIQIASAAGRSADLGYQQFLKFLAVVSISLGIMNLLPVPILDGGHLLFFGIEKITGRPVSERTEMFLQRIGMMFLALLMSLAFYNDIMRMLVPGYGLDECPRF